MTARNLGAAVAAAALLFVSPSPAAAGWVEQIKKGWQELKASFRTAPEEARKDGEKTWDKAREGAAEAADKSGEAARKAVKDAKEGWREVKDAFQSQ